MRDEKKEIWYHWGVRPDESQIREAVRLYYEEGLTQEEIGKKFNRSNGTISVWINKFAKDLDNPDMNRKKLKTIRNRAKAKRLTGIVVPETSAQPTTEPSKESAEEKIKRLERELADARLARDFYNEMINVAERQFNISIRKKAGTRQ